MKTSVMTPYLFTFCFPVIHRSEDCVKFLLVSFIIFRVQILSVAKEGSNSKVRFLSYFFGVVKTSVDFL